MTKALSYDEMPYQSNPFAQTHPDRLATVATLFGLPPPPPDRCRVLELGCAAGGNLIPMALALPDSTFVGIDFSAKQVAAGQEVIAQLGLKNVRLEVCDILDVGPDYGTFDYLICHGVFSWVPRPVQDRILELFHRHLAPDGVGYVSYNTYPGWHLRGVIRDMMCFHAKAFATPAEQVEQARALLDFLAQSCRRENDPYTMLLRLELEVIKKQSDWYIYHEHLEDTNEPIYFHQFVERLKPHDLRYLADCDVRGMVPSGYPPDVVGVLHEVAPEQIHLEQYLDFLRNRMFRQTLLCHRHHRPNYALQPAVMRQFYLASPVRPEGGPPDLRSQDRVAFQGPGGVSVSCPEPLLKAALLYLGSIHPRAVPFDTLLTEARARVAAVNPDAPPPPVEADAASLGQLLLQTHVGAGQTVLELSLRPPRYCTEVSLRPIASPLARLQARAGHRVVNWRHEVVELTDFDRHLLPFLDGAHDRSSLRNALAELINRGVLHANQEGKPVTDTWQVRDLVTRALNEQLPRLAKTALLIG